MTDNPTQVTVSAPKRLTARFPGGVWLPSLPDIDLVDLAAGRLARLRELLASAPYDALILTNSESVQYATGYRSVPAQVFRNHGIAAVVTDDDLWLVCAAADAPAAAALGVRVERMAVFGRFYVETDSDGTTPSELTRMSDRNPDLGAALKTVVRQLPKGTRFGLEAAATQPVLASLLPDPEDASSLVARARSVKLPSEVALLRYAANLSEVAVQTALNSAQRGITERELAAVIASTMVAGGGDPRFVVATTGERSALADTLPTNREWKPGEIARFDVGCVVEGYWSDIGRTAVLGDPDARQQRVYAAVEAGVDAQLDLARPGVTAASLFEAGLAGTAAGVATYRRQHCGHGIGLSIYEPPVLAAEVDIALCAGMTICLETPYYHLGWGGMMVEDTIIVTEMGVQLLSGTGRELTVVQA